MFKKLFFGGSTLLLALGLVFGATPVFAQRAATDSTSNVPMPPPVLATITSMAPLLSFPPQLNINGTLPSPCYSPVVTTLASQLVGSKISGPSTTTITILVQLMRKAGGVCTQVIKPFSTTVSLDPRAMKLGPGSYTVLVNPGNSQGRFKTTLVVH